jgi:flap endonuclease-1
MGIKGLMKLLDEEAPGSYREQEKKSYFARTVAIDASMQLYQFLIQVRSAGDGGRGPAQMLMNEEGEVTSHLQGFFNRATNLLENGIKPVFVFDGSPPVLKSGELAKRKEAKAKAEAELKEAELRAEEAQDGEEGEAAVADMDKAAKRTVRVTKEHNDEVKKLLRLMGLPVVEAPCEAEAQCAELAKAGKVFATATEDMDALTFATPILLRKLTVAESRKEPVLEIHVDKVLGSEGLNLTYDQFVDLCILCGCDYCDTIRGIGSKTALKLIREHGNIETIISKIDRTKYSIPEAFDNAESLAEIRNLFKKPSVKPAAEVEITFGAPNKEGLLDYLVKENGFNQKRVQKVIDRLVKVKTSGQQTRLDAFFKPVSGSSSSSSSAAFKKPAGTTSSSSSAAKGKKRGNDEKSSGAKKTKMG